MTEETQKKISKWFWIIITFPVLLLLFMILLVWAFADIPSFKELENPDNKLATQIIAEGGEVLTTFHIENRTYVTYEELSPNVVHAAIATEDARFYNHSGIDFKGLARVLFKTILMRNTSQGGGSTITQQLAKTLYPRSETRSKIPGAYQVKMVWIKLKEWITAVKLEKNYTKDEIMTMYLNSIFFGSNAYGIRSAAETFFAKTPAELTVEEAATLIGMANKPTRYNPALNPEAIRRSKLIVDLAKELETDIITTHIGVVPKDPKNPHYAVIQDACGELAAYADKMEARFAVETGPELSSTLRTSWTGCIQRAYPSTWISVTPESGE